MSTAPVRIGYVGAGVLAQRVHIPNFASLSGCELVALAELRTDLGEKVQRRYGIPKLYRSHLELAADPEVEAVAISAAFALQGDIARDCLLAGKHVFVEKPLALSVARAERIVAASRETGARLMVAYMKRYDAGNELVRRVVAEWRASGGMGAPILARAHGFGGDWTAGIDVTVEQSALPLPTVPTEEHVPDWLPHEHVRGYVAFVQQYCHNVNLLRFLLLGESSAGERISVRYADFDADGYTGVAVLDVDGVRSVLETGSMRHHRWDEHTQIYFQRGWVHTWAPPLLLRNATAEVEVYRSDDSGTAGPFAEAGVQHTITRPLPEPRWSWAYKREAEHFIACLRSGEPFRSSGEDALVDARILEEIYRTWLNR